MTKVPPSARFVDVSDFTRPLADLFVRLLLPTPISPRQMTLAFVLVGTAAAALLTLGRGLPIAGLLLILKAALDGADGALARARHRPSRIGRYLDSIGDFWVNACVYLAIGWQWSRSAGAAWPMVVALLAWLSAGLQVSQYNYYYVLYRHAVGGDVTSQLDESQPSPLFDDSPGALRLTGWLYQILYRWQDRWIAAWDDRLAPGAQLPTRGFLTAGSILGLGTQLLVIALAAFIGQPQAALWLILAVFNGLALGLLAARAFSSRRLDG